MQDLHRFMGIEVRLELFGSAVLDGVAARHAREQAGTGEIGKNDGHGVARSRNPPHRVTAGSTCTALRSRRLHTESLNIHLDEAIY
ncbi:unnamed protein product [Stenotrophomonas maltophilia]|nr:unnamed protein product [Stenotrophomonas maltophilia]